MLLLSLRKAFSSFPINLTTTSLAENGLGASYRQACWGPELGIIGPRMNGGVKETLARTQSMSDATSSS